MIVFFDVQRFATNISLKKYPVTKVFPVDNIATRKLASLADIVDTIENVASFIDNVGSIWKDTKDLIENYKDDKAFFETVSTLSNFLALLKNAPEGDVILGAMGNAASLGADITKHSR